METRDVIATSFISNKNILSTSVSPTLSSEMLLLSMIQILSQTPNRALSSSCGNGENTDIKKNGKSWSLATKY